MSATVLLHFANTESLKTSATLKLYDLDNRLLASGKSEKLTIARRNYGQMWQLLIANLSVGIYRVDVEVGDGAAWRQFFKITE